MKSPLSRLCAGCGGEDRHEFVRGRPKLTRLDQRGVVGIKKGQLLSRVRAQIHLGRLEAGPPAEFDRETYKWRHLIENLFGRLKEYRGIAMRCCKTDESFSAFIALAATVIRLR